MRNLKLHQAQRKTLHVIHPNLANVLARMPRCLCSKNGTRARYYALTKSHDCQQTNVNENTHTNNTPTTHWVIRDRAFRSIGSLSHIRECTSGHVARPQTRHCAIELHHLASNHTNSFSYKDCSVHDTCRIQRSVLSSQSSVSITPRTAPITRTRSLALRTLSPERMRTLTDTPPSHSGSIVSASLLSSLLKCVGTDIRPGSPRSVEVTQRVTTM